MEAPPPPPAAAVADASSLAALVTVVVTTSPAQINPSTELIEQVLHSLACHAPALAACRVLIVCDGFRLVPAKNTFRAGRVTEAAALAAART